jgi:hypothetical protein
VRRRNVRSISDTFLEVNRACPTEDSDGIAEYEEWLIVLKDLARLDHAETV